MKGWRIRSCRTWEAKGQVVSLRRHVVHDTDPLAMGWHDDWVRLVNEVVGFAEYSVL
jgi:hypothetical protein